MCDTGFTKGYMCVCSWLGKSVRFYREVLETGVEYTGD